MKTLSDPFHPKENLNFSLNGVEGVSALATMAEPSWANVSTRRSIFNRSFLPAPAEGLWAEKPR